MKKTSKFIIAAMVAAVLSAGTAVASPSHHHGGHNVPRPHPIVRVQPSPRRPHIGHHHRPRPHHYHHHHHKTGNIVLATAILVSALM